MDWISVFEFIKVLIEIIKDYLSLSDCERKKAYGFVVRGFKQNSSFNFC